MTNKTWDHFWYVFFPFFWCVRVYYSLLFIVLLPFSPPSLTHRFLCIWFLFLMVTVIDRTFKTSAALVTVVDTVWVCSLFLLRTFRCGLFLTQELVRNRITSQFSVLPAAGLGLLMSLVTDCWGSSRQ